MPLRLLRDRNRSFAYLIITVAGAVVFGLLYFITFYLQGVLGYSALRAGVALLPGTLVVVVATQASALLMARVGPKRLVLFGTLVADRRLVVAVDDRPVGVVSDHAAAGHDASAGSDSARCWCR